MTTMGTRIRRARKAKKLTQQQLADHFKIKRVSATQWENDITTPGAEKLPELARLLGGSVEYYLDGTGSPPEGVEADELPDMPATKANASFPPRWETFPQNTTVPQYGQVIGGPNGRFVLNGQEVGRVFCPPMLAGVEGAYSVRVYGTSMEPRYFAGETIWLNPHEPIRSNDFVVVQISGGDEDESHRESYIKQFVARSNSVLRLRQLNPDEGESELLEFPADRVIAVHKIVFQASL